MIECMRKEATRKTVTEQRWIPVSERLPDADKYILVSFENFTISDIGRYETDKDGSGAFYPGNDDKSYVEYGLFVNAWMPMPEPYRESEDNMERLTYVAENGEVLFHPADLPDDEGITITQLAKDGRYKALEEIAERLANREQAEEQGLLLRLPCKVGDTLYRVNKGAKEPVIMMRVIQLYVKQLHKDRTVIRIDAINDNDMDESCYFLEDIGEKVFFTREEAETKLKEMEN